MSEGFLPCQFRQQIVHYERNGTKSNVYVCIHQDAPTANQPVEPEICKACPLQEEKPKRKLTPKTPPKLSRSLLTTENDLQAPGYPDCSKRVRATIRGCCGASREIRLCHHPKAIHYEAEVSPSICQECPVRSMGTPLNHTP